MFYEVAMRVSSLSYQDNGRSAVARCKMKRREVGPFGVSGGERSKPVLKEFEKGGKIVSMAVDAALMAPKLSGRTTR